MACTDVQTIQAGNGTKTQFSFDFPYIFKSEIHVYFWNVVTKEYDEKLTTDATYPWRITDANPTIVEFTGTAPPSPAAPTDPNESTVDNVKIRRITKVDDIRALFNPGSAIRSDDLNSNFEQLRYAIQESNCQGVSDDVDQYLKDYYWDRYDNTLYNGDTWVSDDTKIATTAALDARFQDEVNDTLTKAELAAVNNVIPDNDVAVPTTGTVKDYVDHVVETDILVDSTGLNKTGLNGQVTIGISANSVDLDRIKSSDIIASGDANPNNNTTIATTAKIDDMIDEAITGDIAGSDGVSITNDGDGTITVGLTDSAVDFDKIKNTDKIRLIDQSNNYAVAGSNDKVFTSSAAIRRFENYVQLNSPTPTAGIGKGAVWLQNDDDLTISMWSGSSWVGVASGGTFISQPQVIYVDATAGLDTNDGHRISRPKQSIKAAINDINAGIQLSTQALNGFNGGSGYTNGTYTSVPLTGGTIGSGVTATITVSGGAVTAVTNVTNALQDYQIGDVLSAADANLGGGGGSGLAIPIIGDGDGMIVIVSAGVYQEVAPIQIKRRNVSIIGQALRSCIVHPTVATQGDQSAGNHALLELNSGSFIQNLTLTGMKASNSGTNTIDAALPANQGWNFAFYSGANITKSPYIQNCTNFSDSEIDNSNLNAFNPRGGNAGDTDSAPTGGGMLIDGSTVYSSSPLRSMVADSYTHVGLNGPGILVTNNGYTQCTSSYAFFNKYHIKTLNGGQANLAASTTDFGERALVADGKSTTAIFTASTTAAAADGATTFTINAPVADSSWFGTANRPGSNMLVTLNSVTYPVLSATANGSGWDVTISRPNPSRKSQNLGLNGAVASGSSAAFFLRSMIASSGHTMEYVGSGTNYSALPENGGVPNDTNQITELNDGKIWTATTDHNGKFTVGPLEVDQRSGAITIASGSQVTNVVEDPSPQLGGNLDVNGNSITSTSNANIVLDPNGTGTVDVSSSRITNVTNPTGAQDAATKSYVDNSTMSAADILTSIKTVDGAGSGLDADTVDGIHASSFLRSDANSILNGTLTVGGTSVNGSEGGEIKLTHAPGGSLNGNNVVIDINGNNLRIFEDSSPVRGFYLPINEGGNGIASKIWHQNNDGSGSGLDADTVDGLQSSSFLRSDTSDDFHGDTSGNVLSFKVVDGRTFNSSSANLSPLQIVQNSSSAGDAAMTFHLNARHARYFGLDSATNDLFTGGWSAGSTKFKIWHQGNDGTGSGLDADTVDGIQAGSFLRSDANDTLSAQISGHASNTPVLRVQSATYSNRYIELGGWFAGTQNNISRIQSSGNLHIDSPANGDLYFNYYNNRPIRLGSGNLLFSGVFKPHANYQGTIGEGNNRFLIGHFRYLRGSTVATPGVGNSSSGYALDNSGAIFFSRNTGTPLHLNRNNNGTILQFRRNNVEHGRVLINTNAAPGVSYSTNSDYRLKENVVVLDNAIDRCKQLLPKRFNFIGNDVVVDGFLAHEAQTVVPEAVDGVHDGMEDIGTLTEWDGTVLETDIVEPDADEMSWETTDTDEDGNETTVTRTRTWTQTGSRAAYQGIDQAKLVPLLTAALQEAIAKIETLETKVAALEAAN